MVNIESWNVDLVQHMGTDLDIANAARVSRYTENKEPTERDRILIHNLAKNQHSTPFEHVVFKFRIKCPIYTARQIFRHRTFSYNELSRMYTHKDISFYIEHELYRNAKSFELRNQEKLPDKDILEYRESLYKHCEKAVDLYNRYIEMGIANEYARAVLPQNLITEFVMTGNLRNWMHFVKLRIDNFNDIELVHISKAVLEAMKEYCPIGVEELFKYQL